MSKTTPFFEKHQNYKGKIVDFCGFQLPVQYSGIVKEHNQVRESAGLFDVSHMGEFEISGPGALKTIEKIITNKASKLNDNQILYTPMCYKNGTIVDDLLVYKFSDKTFWMVVNAANTEKDFKWVKQNIEPETQITNISDEICQLALQGPKAETTLQKLTEINLSEIKYYWFQTGKITNIPAIISRTGYTGEKGFEIYYHKKFGNDLWDTILKAGKEFNIIPVGLGARDTLRFEACLMLYGNDISDKITPLEAGLKWAVKLKKEFFIGQDILKNQRKEGLKRKLIGFEMIDKGIARHDYEIFDKENNKIGFVSSGSFAPFLKRNLGMGFVQIEHANIDNEIFIGIRNKKAKAKIIKMPFYKNI